MLAHSWPRKQTNHSPGSAYVRLLAIQGFASFLPAVPEGLLPASSADQSSPMGTRREDRSEVPPQALYRELLSLH